MLGTKLCKQQKFVSVHSDPQAALRKTSACFQHHEIDDTCFRILLQNRRQLASTESIDPHGVVCAWPGGMSASDGPSGAPGRSILVPKPFDVILPRRLNGVLHTSGQNWPNMPRIGPLLATRIGELRAHTDGIHPNFGRTRPNFGRVCRYAVHFAPQLVEVAPKHHADTRGTFEFWGHTLGDLVFNLSGFDQVCPDFGQNCSVGRLWPCLDHCLVGFGHVWANSDQFVPNSAKFGPGSNNHWAIPAGVGLTSGSRWPDSWANSLDVGPSSASSAIILPDSANLGRFRPRLNRICQSRPVLDQLLSIAVEVGPDLANIGPDSTTF